MLLIFPGPFIKYMKNKKKYLLIILLPVLFSIICLCCNKPYGIRFEKEIYDFGTVIEGQDVSYTFVFKNTGTQIITITRVQPACVCTIAKDWDRTVEPGKKGKILVVFKTPSLNGEVTKVIFVKTNIPKQGSIQLTLKGNVVIPIEIIPRNTWLGDVDNNTKQLSGSFKIINNTDKPLIITEVIPPDIDITFILTTIEENKRYSLDYVIFPPFVGEETVGNLFTLKTNLDGNESIELKFFYYKKPLL